MEPKSGKPQTFYRWVDESGRLHVVSSLESVPQAERSKVAAVVIESQTSSPGPHLQEVAAWRPDWISFAVGFGAALVLSALFKMMPQGPRFLWRAALVVGAGVLLTGLYLTAVRSSAGLPSGGVLTSPSALIQDAKGAVEQMNLRQKQQEEELRQIQTAH